MTWKGGTKLQSLVYNRDFVTKNFNQSAELKGIFTLGEKNVDTLNKIAAAKGELDKLTTKIETLNLGLHGEDGTGGKKGELAVLDVEFTATQFIKPMSTGRNRPLLLGCEDAGGKLFEVVVKFRGREMDEKAQTAELIAAQLADDLGLQVPQAATVDVPPGFEAVISERELVKMVKDSPGLNFGSVHVGTGFTTWPPGRKRHPNPEPT